MPQIIVSHGNDNMSEPLDGPDAHGYDGCDDSACDFHLPRPMHGDVWCTRAGCHRFSVMHVCGHHDPPHVTGYWWRDDAAGPDPGMHDSIPLPRFTSSMDLVEREDFDA